MERLVQDDSDRVAAGPPSERQILKRQLQSLIWVGDGELEEAQYDKLYRSLSEWLAPGSVENIRMLLHEDGFQFVKTGLRHEEERVRAVCLRLLGDLSKVLAEPLRSAISPSTTIFSDLESELIQQIFIASALNRPNLADDNTLKLPEPTPITVVALLDAMTHSSTWINCLSNNMSEHSVEAFFAACLQHTSHVIQTHFVTFIAAFCGSNRQDHIAIAVKCINAMIIRDSYIEIHPTIVPLLAETLLSAGAQRVLDGLSSQLFSVIWRQCASYKEPIICYRSRETLQHFLQRDAAHFLADSSAKLLEVSAGLVSDLICRGDPRAQQSAIKFLGHLISKNPIFTWVEEQLSCLFSILTHSTEERTTVNIWTAQLRLSHPLLCDSLLSLLQSTAKSKMLSDFGCSSALGRIFLWFAGPGYPGLSDIQQEATIYTIESLVHCSPKSDFLSANEDSLFARIIEIIASVLTPSRQLHAAMDIAAKWVTSRASVRLAKLLIKQFQSRLEMDPPEEWETSESIFYATKRILSTSLLAPSDIGLISSRALEIVESVSSSLISSSEAVIAAAELLESALLVEDHHIDRIINSVAKFLPFIVQQEDPLLRMKLLDLTTSVCSPRILPRVLQAVGAQSFKEILGNISRRDDDYEVGIRVCKLSLMLASLKQGVFLPSYAQFIVSPYLDSSVPSLRLTVEYVMETLENIDSVSDLSDIVARLTIKSETSNFLDLAEGYPLQTSKQNDVDCPL